MAKNTHTDVLANLYNDLFSQNPENFDQLLENSAFAAFSFLPDGDVPAQAGHGSVVEAASGAITSSTSITSLSSGTGFEWTGVTFSGVEGYYYPPDNGLATNYNSAPTVVTAENGAVDVTTFTNTSGGGFSQSIESWTSFFSVQSGFSLSDPRVLFDGSHFIVGVDEIKTSAGLSNFAYEVSKDTAPSLTSGWSSTVHISTTEGGTWSDQPLVAVDNGYMYVTTNQFTPAGQYSGDYLTVISNYTDPSAVTASSLALDGPSYQPTVISDGTSPTEYFVSHFNNALHIISATGASVDRVDETVLTTANGLLAESGSGSLSVSQAGTSFRLDAGDGRVTSAAYDAHNNDLYAVFEIQTSNGTPGVELVQYDMTHSLVSVVNLNSLAFSSLTHTSGSTAGASTFNASVAVDNVGDVIVNFNLSGPKMFADDIYALWKSPGAGAAPSLHNAPNALVDFQAGLGAYIDPGHDKVGRWGDYSSAVSDGSASGGFLVSNEFDNGTVKVVGQSLSSWGTETAHVTMTA